MKNYLLVILTCSIYGFTLAHTQTIDGKPIADLEGPYMEVVLSNRLFGDEVKVMIDYGQLNTTRVFRQTEIKDKNGRHVSFHSAVEVLNYFHQYSFKLSSTMNTDDGLPRYILCYDNSNRGNIQIPVRQNSEIENLKTGADQLEKYLPLLRGKKVGILGNQTSIVGGPGHHLVDALIEHGIDVRFAFAPEHGFRGKIERGEKVSKDVDAKTGITLHSLYGKNNKADSIIASVDIMIFDLQDVGARFYTYITSLHRLMQLCVDVNRPLLILDRPNPNGDQVNGPVRKSDRFKSNVSYHKIAMVHGLTVGELAHMINGERWLRSGAQCDLTVIPVEGYTHATLYEPPVIPSPSLPNYHSIRMYPSLCLFEGTDISVARGTDFPFQAIGYPDPVFGGFTFTPGVRDGMSAHVEQQGNRCYGLDLRGIDAKKFTFTLKYFIEFYQKASFKDKFISRPEFFDKLAGNDSLRKNIQDGWTYEQIEESWQPELNEYKQMRKKYLLYDDFE